jgi:pimeloyl-ACP methyl ester carboxylesterase
LCGAYDDGVKFVMVPGGWQGGWVFESVAAELRRNGHQVEAVTLSGLELDGPVGVGDPPNLDTHIDQVAELIDSGDQTPVALCGHSYGGMVIAGVADRLGDRLDQLVFIDAYVPDDGDSCWSLTSDSFRELFIAGARADGGAWPGSPFGTLTERLRHDPGWQVHEVPVGHNIARRDPQRLAEILNALPAADGKP